MAVTNPGGETYILSPDSAGNYYDGKWTRVAKV